MPNSSKPPVATSSATLRASSGKRAGSSPIHARAMGSVGYKQVRDHIDGAIAEEDLASAIVRATRVFARRQRTWLRDQPVEWV